MFACNVQHDCRKANCSATGQRAVQREQTTTDLVESCIAHQSLDEYLINIHTFHNAHLLRECLPHELVAPLPFRSHRQEYHHEVASQLRDLQDEKREAASKKRKEKKAAQAGLAGTVNSRKRKRVEGHNGPNSMEQPDVRVGQHPQSPTGSVSEGEMEIGDNQG